MRWLLAVLLVVCACTPRPEWLTTGELQSMFGSQQAYLQQYDLRRPGQVPELTEFDPKHLWAPHSAGTVALPDTKRPLFEVADALAQVCAATGQTLEELLTTPTGRKGNPANWVAAWWMSRRCGISHGQISAALGASHVIISQRFKRVEERRDSDPRMRAWLVALGKDLSVNT